ncbi:hypothetical protein [Spiroplasma endosymbiont of Megaselia nigra]|uniref:hypothetical protein n=1 Tax=Spiroplasma endosymbiont of Megaselia nigra TaxID=2478537 RepID=UPI000F892997|nr:hypothetical protein [Spiroplasma endosymbiont of Megaselia nigra]RUO85802.1 hypothetical protein D9R21_06670 [Spiroplasma endosymbiont of Megaselia nigra]
MKLDENICILLRCEELKLFVDKMGCFCVEHSKRFVAFLSRYEVDSEVDNMLENNEEFQKEFFTDMVYEFCYEEIEEWHKINRPPIEKKKPKKKKAKNNKKRK